MSHRVLLLLPLYCAGADNHQAWAVDRGRHRKLARILRHLCMSAVQQQHLVLNRTLVLQGLREFPSSVIVPMMQISWTMFSILSGGIYFHEYRVFTAFTGTMFALGVAVRPAQCVNMACLCPRVKLERCRQKRRMSRMDCSSLPGFLTPDVLYLQAPILCCRCCRRFAWGIVQLKLPKASLYVQQNLYIV